MNRREFIKTLSIGAGVTVMGLVSPSATYCRDRVPEIDLARQPSLWEKDVGLFPETPVINSDLQVDVAIIGAGITGLSAALTLRHSQADLRICVIDSHRPCSGSSSRNSGHLVGEYHAWKSVLLKHGPEVAIECTKFANRGLESILDFIQTNNIECNLNRESLMLVGTQNQIKALHKLATQMSLAGMNGDLYEGKEFQGQLKTPFYYGAIEFSNNYIIHPGKLMKGILERAIASGIQVYANSLVINFTTTDSVEETNILKTSTGTIVAKKVLFATNAYTPRLDGLLSSRLIPIHVAIIATRPMTSEEKTHTAFKWRHLKEIQLLSRTIGITPDNRVYLRGIFGYSPNNSCIWKNEDKGYQRLEKEMRDRLPWVKGLEVTEKWYGPVGVNVNGTPIAGPLHSKGQFICVGYNGVGMVDGFYYGQIIAHRMIGAEHPDITWLKDSSQAGWIPLEPFRSVGTKIFFFFGLK